MSAFTVQFGDGSRALLVGYAPGVLSLTCDCAYPPGKPLDLQAQLGDETLALRGKSAGSKRRPDGRYDVMLRLVSLRREQREQLERAFLAR
jgi:hypothetical protein